MRLIAITVGALFLLGGCVDGFATDDASPDVASFNTTKIMLPSGEHGYFVGCNPIDGEVGCYKQAETACSKGYDIIGARSEGWVIKCH